MEGWKTAVFAVIGMVAAIAQAIGVVFPQDDQAAIGTGIVALVMLILRFRTQTKIFGGLLDRLFGKAAEPPPVAPPAPPAPQ